MKYPTHHKPEDPKRQPASPEEVKETAIALARRLGRMAVRDGHLEPPEAFRAPDVAALMTAWKAGRAEEIKAQKAKHPKFERP